MDELKYSKAILTLLQDFAEAGCRVFLISSDQLDVRKPLSSATTIDVQASGEDLERYVAQSFAESDFANVITARMEL